MSFYFDSTDGFQIKHIYVILFGIILSFLLSYVKINYMFYFHDINKIKKEEKNIFYKNIIDLIWYATLIILAIYKTPEPAIFICSYYIGYILYTISFH